MIGESPDKYAGQKEKIALRQQKAYNLRVSGYSYRKIGKELDMSYQQALNDVRAVLKMVQRETFEIAEQHITLELSRLDAVLYAMSARMSEGDTGAASVFLKACESRRKLLGLDAVNRLELTGANGGPIEYKEIDEDAILAASVRIQSGQLSIQSPTE